MLFITIVKVALKSILSNKLRSILTTLGIIIGVGAVIAMLAIGTGAQEQITSNIKSMGSNLLFIRPGSMQRMGVHTGSRENLKDEEMKAVLAIAGVASVSPEVNRNYQIKYLNKNKNTNVYGVAPTYFEMRNYEIDKGRSFTDMETLNTERVAVLGPDTASELFENSYPIGKTIKINGLSFTVIGLTKAKGDAGFQNPDEMVFVPFTTHMSKLTGRDYFSSINLSVQNEDKIETIKEEITKTIRKLHKLKDEDEDDFNIRDMTELLENVQSTIFTFKLLLSGIAALSLLVGGIGIMNIMFVTVTERTREIGVRKALGAKNRDILSQFLLEAVVLTVIGGLIGILFGAGGIQLYNELSPATYFKGMVDITSIFISVAFSISVGVFFGFYPAWKAAQMNPIEALRYE